MAKESQGTERNLMMGVSTFPKGIGPKVNVIAGLEFKLSYYDVDVLHISHDDTETPPSSSFWVFSTGL